MPNTSRMGWPYPAEDENPWYDKIVSLFEKIDSAVYGLIEDKNLVMLGGGAVTWSSNTLTWTGDIVLVSPLTGYKMTIAAGSISVPDGYLLYVDVTRAAQSAVSATFKVRSTIPSSELSLMLGVASGTTLYLRNGLAFNDGNVSTTGVNSYAVAITQWGRYDVTVGTDGDSWVGKTQSAATQAGLGSGDVLSDALFPPESLGVYVNGVAAYYTTDVTGKTSSYWTFVTSGTPQPVLQFGSTTTTLMAGDIVTIQYPVG